MVCFSLCLKCLKQQKATSTDSNRLAAVLIITIVTSGKLSSSLLGHACGALISDNFRNNSLSCFNFRLMALIYASSCSTLRCCGYFSKKLLKSIRFFCYRNSLSSRETFSSRIDKFCM